MSRIEDGGAVEAGLVELIRTAVRFYDQSAGAGLIIFGEPDPADYISEFLDANPDAWDRLDSFVVEAVAAKAAEITRLRAENAGMREALEFYGDPAGWNQPPVKTYEGLISVEYENQASKIQKDRGRVARAALSKASQAEGQTP